MVSGLLNTRVDPACFACRGRCSLRRGEVRPDSDKMDNKIYVHRSKFWLVCCFSATGHVLCLFKEKGKNSLMFCDFLFSSENSKRIRFKAKARERKVSWAILRNTSKRLSMSLKTLFLCFVMSFMSFQIVGSLNYKANTAWI